MARGDVTGKKVYIAGKITGLDRTDVLRKFGAAEMLLREMGAIPFNPLCLPEGFSWSDYMSICLPAVRVCDAVYALDNWADSRGARTEVSWAQQLHKEIYCEEE